jgi:DNA-binding transcriptional LysR family regulator
MAMARSLPPLNALRAFEAAARHLSFTLAAEELHVTQAAVSHQIKALEAYLGVQLFRRMPRRLFLTEEGQALLPEVSAGFDRLAQAVARVGSPALGGTLSVTLLTTFALGWLVPRLPRFTALYPEIDVRLSATPRLVDFAREDVDCGIRHGDGNWPGLYVQKLLDGLLTPLCSPELARSLKRPEDLSRVPLLQSSHGPFDDWAVWFRHAGLAGMPINRGTEFDSTMIAVQAAMQGLGVAVGDPRFYQAEILSGRLVQPFDLVTPEGDTWWFACLPAMADRPKIKAFREWLVGEARATAGNATPQSTPARAEMTRLHQMNDT